MSASGEANQRPRVVVADADGEELSWLRETLGDTYLVEEHRSGRAALAAIAARPPEVLIVGRRLEDMSGARLLAEAREIGGGSVSLFVGDPDVDHPPPDAVFYVLNRSVAAGDVRALVNSAASRAEPAGASVSSPDEAMRLQRVLEVFRRLAVQRDLSGASAVAVEAVIEFATADRAYCLFHDAEGGTLWAEGEDGEEHSASAGLVGFAARTGAQTHASRVSDDPRHERRIDDPRGDGHEHLVAQPVLGPDRQVHAVLVAVREGRRSDFGADDRRALVDLAEQWGPLLHQLSLEVEAESVLAEARERQGGLFREEAVQAMQARRQRGDVVRVSPAWVTWTYWMLVGLLVAAGTYAALGRVDQYSSGPALIRSSGRTEVTAPVAGTLVSLEVTPGERVSSGELLARFYDASESAELERVQNEWETRLRDYLFEPADDNARGSLATLRSERERAIARLEERVVRAPHDGVVSDVRARVGQHLVPGDIVLSLVNDADDLYVIALLPGADRPKIRPGMPMRLELSGYRYAYQHLTVHAVADEVVGPAEARRYIGKEVADSIRIPGSVVMVRGRLSEPTFRADDETYRYHDGMQGMAEVRIDSERIVTAVIPALKGL